MPVWECWVRGETKASQVELRDGGILGIFDKEDAAKQEAEKDKPWPRGDKYECWIRKRTKAAYVTIRDSEIIGVYKEEKDAEREKASHTETKILGKREFKYECTIRNTTTATALRYYNGGIIGVFKNQQRAEAEREKYKPWPRDDGRYECWLRRQTKAFNVYKKKSGTHEGIIGQYHLQDDAKNEHVERYRNENIRKHIWPKDIPVRTYTTTTFKGPTTKKVELEKVFVASRCGEETPSTDSKIVPSEGRGYPCIDVFAVIKAKVNGSSGYYLGYEEQSDLPEQIKIEGKSPTKLKRWNWKELGNLEINWNRVYPWMKHQNQQLKNKVRAKYPGKRIDELDYAYTNCWASGPNDGKWHSIDTLEYKSEGLDTIRQNESKREWCGWQHNVDTSFGTSRYQVNIEYGTQKISSPGKLDTNNDHNLKQQDYDRGIKPTVHRISIRSDNPNKFISYIETYKKVPWIFGSTYLKKNQAKTHQTERFIGFDCADLMVGAARHGKISKIKYVSANKLANTYTRRVGPKQILRMNTEGKIIRVKDNKEVSIPFGTGGNAVQVGDFIFFDWESNGKYDHTTVVYSNEGSNEGNRLNQNTRLIMATHDGVDTRYTLGGDAMREKARFVIRRWPSLRSIYVLLAGFKPWEDLSYNCTQTIVENLSGTTMEIEDREVQIGSIVLPVNWYEAAEELITEVKLGHPDIVIGFGMKTPRSSSEDPNNEDSKFEMEPVAHNKNTDSIDDRGLTPAEVINSRSQQKNSKLHTTDPEKVKDNGSNVLPTNLTQKNLLPNKDIAKAINQRFPNFAFVDEPTNNRHMNRYGTSGFICNQINYNLLYYNSSCAGKEKFKHKVMTGFIHVPELHQLHDGNPESWKKKLIKTAKIIISTGAETYVKRGLLNKK